MSVDEQDFARRRDLAPCAYPQTIADGRTAIQQRLVDTDTPSASVALINGERIAWSETFGLIDKAASTAPDATTMYGIGSVSKVFAAIAVMKLVDQGQVVLDAPLTQYLPDFRMASPEYSQITVRMLPSSSVIWLPSSSVVALPDAPASPGVFLSGNAALLPDLRYGFHKNPFLLAPTLQHGNENASP